MTVRRQLFDVLVAGVVATLLSVPINAAAMGLGTVVGILVASAFYFSRYPWGAEDGDRINDRIDAFYDAHLPV